MHHDDHKSARSAAMTFSEVVCARHSHRDFLPQPVDDPILQEILREAQQSASSCNTQPWDVHVVSGATRDRLADALLAAHAAGRMTSDFSWDETAFPGIFDDRRRAQGAIYYGNLGVARGDVGGRAAASAKNFSFFGAPHVA